MGRHHTIPPHAINYRANVWAMKHLGVRYLISPCAAGSLQTHVKPEHFVVCDQYVDRTRGRRIRSMMARMSIMSAAPILTGPHLRRLAVQVIQEQGITVHPKGTIGGDPGAALLHQS